MIYKIAGSREHIDIDIYINEETDSSGDITFKGTFVGGFFISTCTCEKYYICLKAFLISIRDYAEERNLTVGIPYGTGQLYKNRQLAKFIINDVFVGSSVRCYIYKDW